MKDTYVRADHKHIPDYYDKDGIYFNTDDNNNKDIVFVLGNDVWLIDGKFKDLIEENTHIKKANHME